MRDFHKAAEITEEERKAVKGIPDKLMKNITVLGLTHMLRGEMDSKLLLKVTMELGAEIGNLHNTVNELKAEVEALKAIDTAGKK